MLCFLWPPASRLLDPFPLPLHPTDCQNAVLSLSDRLGAAQDIFCRCGAAFCFNCKEEAHRPVDCETVRQWMVGVIKCWGCRV